MFWAVSATGAIRFWDTRNQQKWSAMLTDYQFADGHYLDVTPDGRYDTNLGPDNEAFRWLVADDPLRSLAPQTFMRNYYEPRLAQRLRQCVAVSGGCARAFPKLVPPTELDRVLPKVSNCPQRQVATREVMFGSSNPAISTPNCASAIPPGSPGRGNSAAKNRSTARRRHA